MKYLLWIVVFTVSLFPALSAEQGSTWHRIYGSEEFCGCTTQDLPLYMVALKDGSCLIGVGMTGNPNAASKEEADFFDAGGKFIWKEPRSGGGDSVLLMKINPDGALAWYEVPVTVGAYIPNDGFIDINFWVRSVSPASDGGFLVYGSAPSQKKKFLALPMVMKYDGAGKKVWEGVYPGFGEEGAPVPSDQANAKTWAAFETDGCIKALVKGDGIFLLNIDASDGRLLSSKKTGLDQVPFGIRFAAGGDFYCVDSQDGYLCAAKYGAGGSRLWIKKFGGKGEDVVQGYAPLWITSDGGLVFCGMSKTFGKNEVGYTVKLSSDGKKQWEKTFEKKGCDVWGHDVIETSDGGLVAAGFYSVKSGGGWATRMITVKYDGNGEKSWEREYPIDDPNEFIVPAGDGGYVIASFCTSRTLGAVGGGDVSLVKCDRDGNPPKKLSIRPAWKFNPKFSDGE